MPTNNKKYPTAMGGDPKVNLKLTDTTLGNMILNACHKHGWTLKELEAETVKRHSDAITYEHLRKMVRGQVFASDAKLEMLAQTLGLKYEVLKEATEMDRMRVKFGPILGKLMNGNPKFVRFEKVLPYLSDDQQDMVYRQMKDLAELNAKTKRRNG